MNGSATDNFDKSVGTQRGVRTPSEVRRLAYQLWAFECGRNCRAVASQLGVGDYNVERWAKKERWAERADAELAAIMPDLIRQSAANLRLAAHHASRRLLTIVNDPAPINHREVDALVKVVAHGGFSPTGRDPLPPPIAAVDPGPDRSTLSLDELIKQHHRTLGIPTKP
jgi:hypothetical protein